MTKTYTIEHSCITMSGGRYKSVSPIAAAKKAATRLFKKAEKSAKSKSLKKISFSIRETTQGSDKKVFNYVATRVKLAQPVVRVIKGIEIVNRYKTEVKADKSANKAAKVEKAVKKTKKADKPKSPKKPKAARKPRAKKSKGGCGCNNN